MFYSEQAATLYVTDYNIFLDSFINYFDTRVISLGYFKAYNYVRVCSFPHGKRRIRTIIDRDQASDHASPSEILVYLHGISFLDNFISNCNVRSNKWHNYGNTVVRFLHKICRAYDCLTNNVPLPITGTSLGHFWNKYSQTRCNTTSRRILMFSEHVRQISHLFSILSLFTLPNTEISRHVT